MQDILECLNHQLSILELEAINSADLIQGETGKNMHAEVTKAANILQHFCTAAVVGPECVLDNMRTGKLRW